jgi:RNA polymerase sigma-70 factor (ECF subfamily)
MALGCSREGDTTRVNAISSGSAALDPDAVLVNAAKSGDPAAFKELFDKYEARIFRLAQTMTQHRADAEDIVQESFLKAFMHLENFHGESRFYTWLARIAVNEVRMMLRKRPWNQVSIDQPSESDAEPHAIEDWGLDPEQRYAGQELQRILAESLNQLEPALRTVFLLRDVEQLSTEETAQMLGISVPAVKTRLLRARLKLRLTLSPYFRRDNGNHFQTTSSEQLACSGLEFVDRGEPKPNNNFEGKELHP